MGTICNILRNSTLISNRSIQLGFEVVAGSYVLGELNILDALTSVSKNECYLHWEAAVEGLARNMLSNFRFYVAHCVQVKK